MTIFKCKICGGDLQLEQGTTVGECDSCGTKQTLPKLDSDRRAQLYDRANHFRRNNDYDKAAGIYETILNEDNTDAEAYWSLVLCKYGVEYVEDHKTKKRIITCNRTLMTSVMADEDYKQAITHADGSQRGIYEDEARAIEQIQKGILEISSYDEPYDVFICYKETDAEGKRTRESVTAQELYHELTEEGFRVFFSRITLENVLGSAYEPHIFAALNSSKVMVVVGSSPENFNAVWVKNEWSRYLALIKGGAKKVLIPAYRDMDAYNLPDEFSHLQAQDMSKLGFMQDLVRGIKKVLEIDEPKTEAAEPVTVAVPAGSIDALLRRANLFLEDGDFLEAATYFNRVLDAEPENAEAYVGLLCAELKLRSAEDLPNHHRPLQDYGNFKKAVRFLSEKDKAVLEGYNQTIIDRLEKARLEEEERRRQVEAWHRKEEKARLERQRLAAEERRYLNEAYLEKQKKERALRIKKRLRTASVVLCITVLIGIAGALILPRIERDRLREETLQVVDQAEQLMGEKKYAEAENLLISYMDSGYPSVEESLSEIYNEAAKEAERLIGEKNYEEAIRILLALGDPRNPLIIDQLTLATNELYPPLSRVLLSAGTFSTIGLTTDGAVVCAGEYIEDERNKEKILSWNGVISVTGDSLDVVGLKADGTVVTTGIGSVQEVSTWSDIIAVSSGDNHVAGLKSDGTVVAVGDNDDGQCDVSDWKDIITVSSGKNHTVGVKSDGTVVAVGNNIYGQCDVSGWRDIIAVSSGGSHTVGIKSDGRVVSTGILDGIYDVSGWRDIVAVSSGFFHIVGLKSDGTVVAVGSDNDGECNVSRWKNIIAVSAGFNHTVGLKSDGTVVAVGDNEQGQCDVSDWHDIIAVSAGYSHTVGLKSDGTVVAVGENNYGQCDVSDWDLID